MPRYEKNLVEMFNAKMCKQLGHGICYYRALQTGEASKVVPIDKMSVVITLFCIVFLPRNLLQSR